MVMEAPPSPQSVGREFVRQYYTLLNKAPSHLHRFYNHQSSFVHDGPNRETSPVIGQKQIHQKIQQLNFHDCHAKITQVDSQATLGNGVVVQVSGELSNAGQPMRRFTQTFVLAAQSPKKYYVHNDIFRYQDEIISDEEGEPECRSDADDEPAEVAPDAPQPPPQQQPPVMPFFGAAPVAHLPHVLAPVANGAVHPDELGAQQQHAMAAMAPPQPMAAPPMMAASPPQPSDDRNDDRPIDDGGYEVADNGQEQQDYSAEPVTSNEPKTYANLLKSGASPYSSPPQQQQYQPRSSSPSRTGYGQPANRNNLNRNNGNNRIGGNNGAPNRVPRQDSFRASGRNSFNDDAGDDQRQSQSANYSDVNQLFLGNLPHNATVEDLREIFVQYGMIVELRVHTKPGNKGPPGMRQPPNYGFITYESQQGVLSCLAARPIYFPKDDSTGIALNVEEKKTKDRLSYGANRLNNDRNRENGPRRSGPNVPSRGGLGAQGPNARPSNYNRNGPPNQRSANAPYNNRR